MKFLFGFSFILSFLFNAEAQGGIPWSDQAVTITTEVCPSGVAGCVNFHILFTEIESANVVYKSFKFVLFPGDGSYIEGFYELDKNSISAYCDIPYKYSNNNISNAYLEVCSAYNDHEVPKRISINPDIPALNQPPTSHRMAPAPDENKNIEIIPIFEPRGGDNTTYIVSFLNSSGDTLNNAYLNFDFPENSVVVKKVIAEGASNNASYLNADNQTGHVTLRYPMVPKSARVNCFVQLLFTNNVKTGSLLNFSAKLELQSLLIDSLITLYETNKDMLAVDSHDPNLITPSLSEMCPNNVPDSIVYRIDFQNIGSRSAYTVIVTDVLPVCYEIDSVRVIKPSGIQKSKNNFSINKDSRTLRWVLNGDFLRQGAIDYKNQLKGTSEVDYGDKFFDAQTKDFIEFVVKFDKRKALPPCGAIMNQAEIVFDNNSPIVTNVSFIQIECDNSCAPCDINSLSSKPILFEVTENVESVLNLASFIDTLGAKFYWYPSTGLKSSYSASPVVSLSSAVEYSVVVTKGCETERLKVKVFVVPDTNGCLGVIGWVILAIASLIGALLFVKNKRRATT